MGWMSRLLGEKVLSNPQEVSTVDVLGRPLKCQVCGHDQFWRHQVLLNTRTLTFFDMEWMNRDATCVVCEQCGYVHWFVSTNTAEENDKST
jgi:predicted nucleic-acid-binding Zn-ribbon protein